MTDAEKRLREMVSMPLASHVTCPVAWVESVLTDLDALRELVKRAYGMLKAADWAIKDGRKEGLAAFIAELEEYLAPPAAPCPECGGSTYIEVGSGQPDGDGGELSQIIDCPRCGGRKEE